MLDSRSETCGLRDRKKVAGVAVRGSRDGDVSTERLREKGFGTGLIMKAFL
jgi:hypothetical protein